MERLACPEYQVAEADVFASVYVWHGVCVCVCIINVHAHTWRTEDDVGCLALSFRALFP